MNRTAVFATLLIALAFPGSSRTRAETFVYVSVSGEQSIVVHSLNEVDGKLKRISEVELSGATGSLALHPSGKYLFASVRRTGHLAALHVLDDGGLVLINETPVEADPSYVSTDRSGKYLFSACYGAGKVTVHSIGRDGSLSSKSLQEISTDEKAHCIVRDPSGKFLFVPHTGPNAIFQFRLDPTSGRLHANDPSRLVRDQKTGPRHLWFHPTLPFAFGSDEQGSSVTSYGFDRNSGLLSTEQTLTTLPSGFTDRNSTSDIEVHPTGKFVYVANRGHDSIAAFAIDDSGKMKGLGTTLTEKTPRSFNISPDGTRLIAAGQNSGKLALYNIRGDGSLKRYATTEVGSKPWWVLIVQK